MIMWTIYTAVLHESYTLYLIKQVTNKTHTIIMHTHTKYTLNTYTIRKNYVHIGQYNAYCSYMLFNYVKSCSKGSRSVFELVHRLPFWWICLQTFSLSKLSFIVVSSFSALL